MKLDFRSDEYKLWRGTPKAATKEVAKLVHDLFPKLVAPTERMLRDWRDEGILTRESHKFTGRNILEAAFVTRERINLHLQTIKEQLEKLTDEQLIGVLISPDSPTISKVDPLRVERTIILLAHGLLKQFELVREGKIVGISDQIPLPLRQAQAHLARLAIESGHVDEYTSVHNLLVRCMQPVKEWAPIPLAQDERFSNAVLIDPYYRVPSEDCGALAELGNHSEDIIEKQLYRMLLRALELMDEPERESAYTLVREFVAEHPLVTREELHKIRNNPRLSSDLSRFFDYVYEQAHPADAKKGIILRCLYCKGHILAQSGTCALVSCEKKHRQHQKKTIALPVSEVLIARPEIRKYWCDPAQEELYLYQGLKKVYGERTLLYPHMDRCDIAIGQEIGIDVKDYQDPVSLARKLSNGLGGLRLYPRMILAVATRRAKQEYYMDRLREHLPVLLRRSLQIMSVEQVLETLKLECNNG